MIARGWALVVVGLWSVSARAQTADDEKKAAALYDEGLRHHQRHEYDREIDAYRRAWELTHAPGFLFDIGQAAQLKGDCAQAIDSYRQYLERAPTAPNRALVEKRLNELGDCQPAREQMPPLAADPDTEVASREFHRGSELYEQGRYEEAIAAFEKAQSVKPLPAFDYNIARCYDRLGRWADAVEHYERYVAASKDPNDVAQTSARIEVLKQRIEREAARGAAPTVAPAVVLAQPSSTPPPPRKRRWIWGVVAGAAVVVVAVSVGLGVGLSGTREPSPSIGVVTWGK